MTSKGSRVFASNADVTRTQPLAGGEGVPTDKWAPVKPVVNAIHILRLVSQGAEPITLTQIARAIGANPSTCLSILRTLTNEKMLSFNPGSKTYSPGLELATLLRRPRNTEIEELLRAPLDVLAQAHAVTLSVWKKADEDRITLIQSTVGGQDISIQMRIGQRLPRWVAAVGRVMAAEAGYGADILAEKFSQLRWQSPPSLAEYLSQVQQVHERGFAIDDGNYARGLVSVAVPVRGRAAPGEYACSATALIGRLDAIALETLAAEMIDVVEMAAAT